MNSIEDRISAATRAAADTVRPDTIPPLRLPADGQARSRPGRSWARLLAPAAAAIAVVVLVVAVVVVSRHMHRAATPANSPVASYVASGQVPPYFVALAATGAANRSPANAEVHATADGRRLATVNPSAPDGTIVAVTGAADDRTFVLAEQPWTQRGVQQYQPRSFYLLRLGSAGQVSSLTKLPISVPADNTLRGLALSPDGRRLAVAVQPGAVAVPCRLTVYTLGSAAARTWSALRSSSGSIGLAPDDAGTLSWTADGRTLAFDWLANGMTLAVRLLSVDSAGSDLLADSRQVVFWALSGPLETPVLPGATATGPFKPQGDVIITPDGSAVVTAAAQGSPQLVKDAVTWVSTQTAVQEYSVTTGKLLRTFGIAKTKPAVLHAGVLWSDPAGRVVIALTTGSRVAVISGNHVTPLNRPASMLSGNADAGVW